VKRDRKEARADGEATRTGVDTGGWLTSETLGAQGQRTASGPSPTPTSCFLVVDVTGG